MTLSATDFLAQYQEFKPAGPIVQVTLDQAALQVDPDIFLGKTDMAVGLLTAHLLSMSPFARTLKLETVNDDKGMPTTKYMIQFQRVLRQVTFPMMST